MLFKYDLSVQEAIEAIDALSSNGWLVRKDASYSVGPNHEDLGQLHVTYGNDDYR